MAPLFPIRLAQTLEISLDQILAYILQAPATDYPSLLDSCQYQDYGLYQGRYLIAATKPHLRVSCDGDQLTEYQADGQCRVSRPGLARLDEILAEHTSDDDAAASMPTKMPGATGAAIGFWSYECGQQFEHWPHTAPPSYQLPQLFWAFYSTLIVYDYQQQQTTIVSLAADHLTATQQITSLRAAIAAASSLATFLNLPVLEKLNSDNSTRWNELPLPHYQSNFTYESYCAAVAQIKQHIAAGDIYQANLTQQLRLTLRPALAPAIFYQLRQQFPVPFAALLRTPEWAIVSGSPECFLARVGLQISSYPIKGTRQRGTNSLDDQHQAAWLQNSEKDRAENVMIVDLLRNDLGRICKIGSIDASQILQLQAFPTLWHLVSKISGELRSPSPLSPILAATFPCGSITGAPKLRAMQILESIEGVQRQLSMGAIGWIGYNQDFCWNVAIRTLVIQQNKGYFNVGSGIVADSDADNEYAESLLKAQAMLRAIATAKSLIP
jgi:aminodeoxychorismate synthase component I